MSAFYVVCVFFELEPVNDGDAGFELVVLFFGALFVRGLAIGSAVVREVADSTDFVKVIPCPCSNTWPVSLGNRDGD